jgi:NAD(P)H-flavin reductase/ferredoxin
MTYTISISDTGIWFPCRPGVTILDAAQAAGWELPYSCRKGACRSCQGVVVSGSVSEDVLPDRTTLFCQAKPTSDLEIAPTFIKKIDLSARKIVDAKVYQIMRPADDVAILQLRFPAGKRVRFEAGQYLEVVLENGVRRSFSMANPPHQNDGAELHVRVVPGGHFSGKVLPLLVRGTSLKVELPFGNFGLKMNSERPIILVASGTGFAPMKSIIEDAMKQGMPRPLTLYWGARSRKDLYALELPQKWATKFAQFRFIPVLSEPASTDSWLGRTGFVHHAVMDDYESLANHEVYACGVTAMVNAARRDLVEQRGLPPGKYRCDAFATPADGLALTA